MAKEQLAKTFKSDEETLKKMDALITKSGKSNMDFFKDLVNRLAVEDLTDSEDPRISSNLQKHFDSDVRKLKNATDSIMSIFIGQMENLRVEKDQWEDIKTKLAADKDVQISNWTEKFEQMKAWRDSIETERIALQKEHDVLFKENEALTKRTEEQETLIEERKQRIGELQERIAQLHETIVEKDEQLKAVQPIIDENKRLETEVQRFTDQIHQLQIQIEKDAIDHSEELERNREKLAFECEKRLHNLRIELETAFQQQRESIRNETRKETQQSLKELYLAEIERKNAEYNARELEFKNQIAELQAANDAFEEKTEELKNENDELKKRK